MDDLLEILLEFIGLILEGTVEVIENKKVPKWIRYPLIVLIILFCLIIIFGLLILGILILNKNIYAGIFIIIISIILLISMIIKFRNKK